MEYKYCRFEKLIENQINSTRYVYYITNGNYNTINPTKRLKENIDIRTGNNIPTIKSQLHYLRIWLYTKWEMYFPPYLNNTSYINTSPGELNTMISNYKHIINSNTNIDIGN